MFALLLLCGGFVSASGPAVQSVTLTERGRDLLLSADVSLELNNQLADAAERGLPLYFSVEVEIRRPRWYWFDQVVLASSQTWRIVHNPLTRQWRVNSGSLALPVGSLSEALSVVRFVRNWRIADRDVLEPGTEYEGRMRVRFDVSQLSKPFQVNALNSSDWSLATPWTVFSVQVGRESNGGTPVITQPLSVPEPPTSPSIEPPPVPSQAMPLRGGAQPNGGHGLTLPGMTPGQGAHGLVPPESP